MGIKLTSTKNAHANGIKALVYGKAGIGKTTLMGTAPNPIILSAEAGLLALQDKDIPVIEIKSVQDADDAYEYLMSKDGDKYDTICLDSISEIAEVCLTEQKSENKDGRIYWTGLADEMNKLIRKFRDMKGKNVIFSAKQIRVTDDDTGVTSYVAAMPGKNLTNGLPFFFDLVLYMSLYTDEDDGSKYRVINTSVSYNYDAKDRSGRLNKIEEPDLSKIFDKITK